MPNLIKNALGVEMNCFNLVPGVVFKIPPRATWQPAYMQDVEAWRDQSAWVVTNKFTRDDNHEVIHVVCRSLHDEGNVNPSWQSFSLSWAHGETVVLIGICVNPNDDDDTDWGGN